MVRDDFPDGFLQADGIVQIGPDKAVLRPTRGTAPSQYEDGIAGSTLRKSSKSSTSSTCRPRNPVAPVINHVAMT